MALALKRQGITNVRPLAGGLQGWLERGYPAVSSETFSRGSSLTNADLR